jgi:ATP-dependent DNA helicase PIF1
MLKNLILRLFGSPSSQNQESKSVPQNEIPAPVANSINPQPKTNTPKLTRAKYFSGFNSSLPKQPVPPDGRSEFRRNPEFEASPGIREALAAIDAREPAILISGRAGTGKTTLIRYIRQRPGGETTAVVAPTAVAALNAGAQTIHSFFHLPPLLVDARNLRQSERNFGQLYRRMKSLIIDEISMVRADILDAVDVRLRQIRENPNPFGGVQLIFVGDFLQLPPVIQTEDRHLLHALGYNTEFAFSAHVLANVPVKVIELDRVYRQDEKEFVEILNRVRLGTGDESVINEINQYCYRPHRAGVQPILLTPTRAGANSHNNEGLAALTGTTVTWDALIEGKLDIAKDKLPVPERLELKVGARVMAVKNDNSNRWINGSLGTVTSFDPRGVFVKFDRTMEEYLVERAPWEKVRQIWNSTQGRIENEVIGAYRQIPLIPAWAITIHKAQGLTLDDVRIDLGSGAFSPGMTYVALSRVRTMAGLSLARPLRAGDIQANSMILGFLEWTKSC